MNEHARLAEAARRRRGRAQDARGEAAGRHGGTLRPPGRAPRSEARRKALSVEWGTPPRIKHAAEDYCGGPIPLDAATWPDNPMGAVRFLVPGRRCGLATSWAREFERPWARGRARVVWLNPPYGEFAEPFYRKAVLEAREGLVVLCLLPANRTETGYLQALMAEAPAECWLRGRVKFVRRGENLCPACEAPAPPEARRCEACGKGLPDGANPFASVLFGLGPVDPFAFARAFTPLGLVRTTRALGGLRA